MEKIRSQITDHRSQLSEREVLKGLIGKPYLAGGRGPQAFDCLGLHMEIQLRAGIECPEIATPEDPAEWEALFIETLHNHYCKWQRPMPWCPVVFRFRDVDGDRQMHWHLGTVLPDTRKMITTTQDAKSHICTIHNNPLWTATLEGYYRYMP